MRLKKIEVSELICVDIVMPAALLSRAAQLAIALIKSNKAQNMLSQTKALRVNKKVFACEHFALIQALKRVHPSLQLEFLLVDCASAAEAKHIILNQIKLTSVSTLNAIEVPAFEAFNNASGELMRVKEWAELFDVDRTTFHHHKRKFQSLSLVKAKTSAVTVELADALSSIPKIDKTG